MVYSFSPMVFFINLIMIFGVVVLIVSTMLRFELPNIFCLCSEKLGHFVSMCSVVSSPDLQ